MNYIERERYANFKKDVLNEYTITTEMLWIFMNRHTQGWMGRKFWSQENRLKYYHHWIKIMIKEGYLQETHYFGHWKVINLSDLAN